MALLIKDNLRLHILGAEVGRLSGGEDSFQGGEGCRQGRDNSECEEFVLEGEAKVGDGACGAD
jgi:hypothetical protein